MVLFYLIAGDRSNLGKNLVAFPPQTPRWRHVDQKSDCCGRVGAGILADNPTIPRSRFTVAGECPA